MEQTKLEKCLKENIPLTLLFNDFTDIDDYVDVAHGIRTYDKEKRSFGKLFDNYVPNSMPYFDIYEQNREHITYLFNRMAEIKEKIHTNDFKPNLEKFGDQIKQLENLSSFMNEYNTLFDLQGNISEEQLDKIYPKYNLTVELVDKLMPLYDMYLKEIRLSNREECELEIVSLIDELVMLNSRFAYIFATYLFNGFDVHNDRLYIVAFKGLLDAINFYNSEKDFDGLLLYYINTRVRRNMTRLYGADYETYLEEPGTKKKLSMIESYSKLTPEEIANQEKEEAEAEGKEDKTLENVYMKMIDLKLFDLDEVSKREYILSEGVEWSLDKIREEYDRLSDIEAIILEDREKDPEEIRKEVKEKMNLEFSVDFIKYVLDNEK